MQKESGDTSSEQMQVKHLQYDFALADKTQFNSPKNAILSFIKLINDQNETAKFNNRIGLFLPIIYGIGAYCGFEYFTELPILISALCSLLLLLLTLVVVRIGRFVRLTQFMLMFALGILIAGIRMNMLATTTIPQNMKIIELSGTIVDYERNFDELPRLIIKPDKINDLSQPKLPPRIRLNLRGEGNFNIGQKVICKQGFIAPPSGKFLPNSYNFARKMWFKRIGAVGNCRNLIISDAKITNYGKIDYYLVSLRKKASETISQGKIGNGYGLLTALVTGDRSYIAYSETQIMQISGLGHIISISGLHVALVGGIAFLLISKILALSENIALRIDVRKIAAFVSISVSLIYVVFTGAESPAVRAFFMSLVLFGAIIFDRRAINMRGLAVAAFFIITFVPESVFDTGFLMSFLATMALIALWDAVNIRKFYKDIHPLSKILVWLGGALLVSLVAGLATAPLVLNNFGRINQYSVMANMLAAPINDFIIGPFALLASFMSLLGMGKPFWAIAAWGCGLLINISQFIADLPYADSQFNRLNNISTIIYVISITWICLFNSKIRYLAAVGFVIGTVFWVIQPVPVALIAKQGVAIMATENDYYGRNRICYINSGRFYARQMIDYAALDKTNREDTTQLVDKKYINSCSLKGGDWQAHFIKFKNTTPVLSLTFNKKTYGFDEKNAPNGAILYRDGWKLWLYEPKPRNTPWGN
jgi:competence protein ComEC